MIEEDLKNSIRNETEREKCKDLLQNLLINEPSNRFKIDRVTNYPFLYWRNFMWHLESMSGYSRWYNRNIDIDWNKNFW